MSPSMHIPRFQLAANERSALQKYLDRAFEAGCDALIEAHAALITLDQENARTLSTRLVLPEGASEQYEQQRKAYEGLHRYGEVRGGRVRSKGP